MKRIDDVAGVEDLTQYNICGVYFLMLHKEVVYVGQSNNIAKRVSQHIKSKKDFDSVKFLRCKKSKLDELELKYIIMFKPRYNKTMTQYNKEYESFAGCEKENVLMRQLVRKVILKSEMKKTRREMTV